MTAVLTWLATLFAFQAYAQSIPSLSNLSADQVRDVSDTFSSMVVFRPLEPASNFGINQGKEGKKWGFAVGAQIGEVAALKMRSFYTGSVPLLPTAQAVACFGWKYGLGIEFGMFPPIKFSGFSFREYGGNLKWTFTDLIFPKKKPFHLALRAGYSLSTMEFATTISGVETGVSFTTKVITTSVAASKQFGVIEPYVGMGYFRQSSTLGFSGTVSIFNQSFTVAQEVTSTTKYLYFYSGFQLHLVALALSLEYDDIGGINGYHLKLGLKI
jgi:hypothetical protein